MATLLPQMIDEDIVLVAPPCLVSADTRHGDFLNGSSPLSMPEDV
ncbi:hypothetical protein [Enterobacter hormaechei]|nr:hypothetical protein [Enterobacter hormaechei]